MLLLHSLDTHCGRYFSKFRFVQATITLLIKLYKTISLKNNPKQNIIIFSSIPHDFFNIFTAEMVNDLSDTHHQKPKLALQTSKSLTHLTDNPLEDFSDNPINSINNPTGITSPPPFHTKHPNKLHMTRFEIISEKEPVSSTRS